MNDDLNSVKRLALESLQELYTINRHHELIGPFLFGIPEGSDEEFEKRWDEFQVRFGKPLLTEEERETDAEQAHFWICWHLAVEKVLFDLFCNEQHT